MLNRLAFGAAVVLPLCALAPVGMAQEEQSKAVSLVCTGSGRETNTQTLHVSQHKRHGDSSFSTVTSTGKRGFSGTAYVEISGSFARVKVPSAMLPTIRGGDDGWFAVLDMFMNDEEVTGKIKLNALNKPKLRIDRISGVLTLSGGSSDFTGECSVQDLSKRKF